MAQDYAELSEVCIKLTRENASLNRRMEIMENKLQENDRLNGRMGVMWSKIQEMISSENLNRFTRWNWASEAAKHLANLPNMEDME